MDATEDIVSYFTEPAVIKVLIAVVGLAVIYGVMRAIRGAVLRGIEDTTTRYRTRKMSTFVGYLVALIFLGSVFSDRMGGVTVALGVAGAGIAFALQEVIVSVAGWITVTFGGFYKVGDRVMLGGIRGDVIDIGVLRTTLFQVGDWVDGDLYNGRVVRLANSFVFKEPVFNYSAEFPFLWDEIHLPIRHGSDRTLMRRLLLEIAEEEVGAYAREVQAMWTQMTRNYVIEHARLEPHVTMVMDQNWMTFTVRYVVEYRRRRTTKDRLFERVLERIDAHRDRVGVASAAQEITLMRSSGNVPFSGEASAQPRPTSRD